MLRSILRGCPAIVLIVVCLAQSPPARAQVTTPVPRPNPTIGDTLVYRVTDLWNGRSKRYSLELTAKRPKFLVFKRTDLESGRASVLALTPQLGLCMSATACFDTFDFPMAIGAKRAVDIVYSATYEIDEECRVEAAESVKVPAGTFDTLRIECPGRWISSAIRDAVFRGRVIDTFWYAPQVNATVKRLFRHYLDKGGLDTQDLTELMEFTPGNGTVDNAGNLAGASQKSPGGSAMVNEALATLQAMPPEFTAGNARFTGKFSRNAANTGFSGSGRVAWTNGDVYEGTMVQGAREGQGTFIWANGQRFEGAWQADRPEGQGKMRFVNGDRYEGSMAAGAATGAGTMDYASGDRYVGDFLDGTPTGHGKYTWATGMSLEGDWVRGQGQGPGILDFASGNHYEGELARGQPNGSGRMLYATGDTYVGTLKDGAPDGEGTYAWKNGDKYVGQWKDGLKDGHGVLTWSNGDRFDGVFSKDQKGDGDIVRAQK